MSSEPQTIQQQLAAEQAAINAMTDLTEAMLARNAYKWKIAAGNGEKGAASELNKAQRALEDYRAKRDDDGWFRSALDAGRWLAGQGYISNRGNAVSADVARKLVETLKKDPHKGYSRRLVIQTADMKWGKPGGRVESGRVELQEEIDKAREQARIAKETADKLAFANEVTRGNYLPKNEVEQMIAASCAFLKQDLENFGPHVVDRFIELTGQHLRGLGVEANIAAIVPDLIDEYDTRLERWLGRYAEMQV